MTGIPRSSHVSPDPAAPPLPGSGHEHGWWTESRHATSQGWVLYVRCACGVRRVDRQAYAESPPVALTGTVRPRGRR